jgi:AcrR family transcriptional regulator
MSAGPRGEQTRAQIVEAALRLFAERGYERTTMRAIADEAHVAVGNAYYYFASKEHLIQGFYDQMQHRHVAASQAVLAGTTNFAARLSGVMRAWLDVAEPYHEFAAQFFKNAADPSSPLSPFSEGSSASREAAVSVMRRVVAGADLDVDRELRAALPELLWLYQMGIVLFWVHDTSSGARRTRMLIDRTVPLAERIIRLSRSRLLRGPTRDVVSLLGDLGLRFADADGTAHRAAPARGRI